MATKSRKKSGQSKGKGNSAARGRSTSGKKSPSGQKKQPSAKSAATASASKRPGTKPVTPQSGAARKPTEYAERREPDYPARRQVISVVLFCTAALSLFLYIIPGQSAWKAVHTVMLGLSGVYAFLWPLLLFYMCFLVASGRTDRVLNKLVQCCVLILLFCTTIYIFRETDPHEIIRFGKRISVLYTQGTVRIGSGAIGGFLGIPLLKLMGSIGAKITICILVFASFMLLTGTTLIQFFSLFFGPVRALGRTMRWRPPVYDDELDDGRDEEYEDERSSSPSRPRTRQKSPPRTNGSEVPPGSAGKEENTDRKTARWERWRRSVLGETADPGGTSSEPEEPPFDTEDGGATSFGYSEAAAEGEPVPPELAELVRKVTMKKKSADPDEKTKTAVSPEEEARDADYRYPPISLLDEPKEVSEEDATAELQTNAELLVSTLKSFGVQTRIVDISRGPAVTRYELQPSAGVKISKITNLSDDLALNLAASGVRIEAPIPGKQAVGIEVPNKIVGMVKMRELVDSNAFAVAKSKVTVALGKDIAGTVRLADLSRMPHLLIAGATGSGKSVCINSLICSLLYKSSPSDVRLLMIDPKYVELSVYNGIPHLLVPVVNDPRKAAGALSWAVSEMLHRYNIFKDYGVRDLASYNRLVKRRRAEDPDCPLERMAQIVIIVDELSDLMMATPKEVEDSICRLAQMARAAGMHLVIATQRPSVDVITGLIKANIPSRIAFFVSSQVDSRTILDSSGAEKLLGRGDMLFSPVGASKPTRIQGCFLSDREIKAVTDYVKESSITNYDDQVSEEIDKQALADPTKRGKEEDAGEDDPIFLEAIRVVVEAGQASTSLLQRRLSLGYARAGRTIDKLEEKGIVGPHEGSKPRKVLITQQQWQEMNMSAESFSGGHSE